MHILETAARGKMLRKATISSSSRSLYVAGMQSASWRGRRRAVTVCEAGRTPVEVADPPIATATVAPAANSEPITAEAQVYSQAPPTSAPPQYYVAPPTPPLYPATPQVAPTAAPSGGLPWWVWVGVGILLANVIGKVQEFIRKGPQQMLAEMAMKQMMSAMSQQQGAPGAASPFGAPGQNPFATPGAFGQSPFAQSPYGGFPPQPAQPAGPTVDVTPQAPPSQTDSKKGEKFASRISESRPSPEANGGVATQNITSKPPIDVVEPVVTEPVRPPPSPAKPSSFFTDVSVEGEKTSTAGASDATTGTPPPPPPGSMPGSTSTSDATSMTKMMEVMLKDPAMQKMLYPYLPEPMRNPQSIEWMLNNKEVRAQMEQVFAQQNIGMSPEMMNMMKQMDFSQEKVQQQFSELGLKPDDVIQKVLANPELAAGFSNPKVQSAIFDISQNPLNISKYQNDPEVMKVLEKVTEIFSPQVNQNIQR